MRPWCFGVVDWYFGSTPKLFELCERGGRLYKLFIYRGKGIVTTGTLGHAGTALFALMENILRKITCHALINYINLFLRLS